MSFHSVGVVSRLPRLLFASALVLTAACGGKTKEPDTAASSPSRGGSQKELRDDGAPTASKNDASTAALLDKLLATPPGPVAPAADRTPAPAAPPPPAATAAPHAAADDSFDDDVARIKSLVPTWDNGTGITARFLKESTGSRVSLIYVDTTPPELNKNAGMWVIQATAKGGDKVLGHFAILMKNIAAGKYTSSPTDKDMIFISHIAEKFDLKATDAMWSTNKGSWAELVLRPGKTGRHLEGNFRAKLTSNDGNSFQTIESGYIYINQ